jgi:hypothetical protein
MAHLQTQILQDEAVQAILSAQKPDGWLGQGFHGYNSMESSLRQLSEKGLDGFQPPLSQALAVLERRTDRLDGGIGKVGAILDENGLGGSLMIRAALFAQAGLEEKPSVKDQVEAALLGFQAVLQVKSLGDLCESYGEKLVFRNRQRWPGIYHLRLLAFTNGWRDEASQQMVTDSIQRLVDLSPFPDIYARHGSQCIAPASFAMHNFAPDLPGLDDAGWMRWFHLMELLARLGVIPYINSLKSQVAWLEDYLQAGNSWFLKRLRHVSFKQWGAYTGMMLEKDWKKPQRRINDLTFRSLLILHYAHEQPV